MSKKVLWIDTETTGLSAIKNDVVQMAGMVEIDGVVDSMFEFECKPHDMSVCETEEGKKALSISGRTPEMVATYPDPRTIKLQMEAYFGRYINKFDKKDKFKLAGYNSDFDSGMMRNWWLKCGDKWWGSWVEYKTYDIYPLFQTYVDAAGIDLPNEKLVTAAAHFGLSFGDEGAHDAMADIRVTREVGCKLRDIFSMGVKCSLVGYTPETLTDSVIGVSTKERIHEKAEGLRND